MVLVYFGGVAILISTLLVAVVGRSPGRLALIAVLGLVLAGLVFFAAYLSAPTDNRPEGCSDCTEWLGRYWEPVFVFWIITINLVAWMIGMVLGGLAHPWASRQLGRVRHT
jgi:hypothetical protein